MKLLDWVIGVLLGILLLGLILSDTPKKKIETVKYQKTDLGLLMHKTVYPIVIINSKNEISSLPPFSPKISPEDIK